MENLVFFDGQNITKQDLEFEQKGKNYGVQRKLVDLFGVYDINDKIVKSLSETNGAVVRVVGNELFVYDADPGNITNPRVSLNPGIAFDKIGNRIYVPNSDTLLTKKYPDFEPDGEDIEDGKSRPFYTNLLLTKDSGRPFNPSAIYYLYIAYDVIRAKQAVDRRYGSVYDTREYASYRILISENNQYPDPTQEPYNKYIWILLADIRVTGGQLSIVNKSLTLSLKDVIQNLFAGRVRFSQPLYVQGAGYIQDLETFLLMKGSANRTNYNPFGLQCWNVFHTRDSFFDNLYVKYDFSSSKLRIKKLYASVSAGLFLPGSGVGRRNIDSELPGGVKDFSISGNQLIYYDLFAPEGSRLKISYLDDFLQYLDLSWENKIPMVYVPSVSCYVALNGILDAKYFSPIKLAMYVFVSPEVAPGGSYIFTLQLTSPYSFVGRPAVIVERMFAGGVYNSSGLGGEYYHQGEQLVATGYFYTWLTDTQLQVHNQADASVAYFKVTAIGYVKEDFLQYPEDFFE